MPRRGIQIALRLSSGVFILSGFAALLTTGDHGPGYIVLALVLLILAPLGEWLDSRYVAYRIISTTIAIGYAVTLVVPLVQYGLLEAVTRLIVFVLGYLLLHRKREHEYYQVFLMTFFLLLSACARFPDAAIGLVLPVFLVSAVWAFLSLQLRVESDRGGAGEGVEIVPLDYGRGKRAAGGSTHSVRALFVSAAAVSLMSLLIASGVFLATPRVGAGFLSADYVSDGSAISGLANEVNLSAGGPISSNNRAVMTAQFPDEPGGRFDPERMYWRAAPHALYGGNMWGAWEADSRIGDERRRIQYTVESPGVLARTESGHGRKVKQVIFADDADTQSVVCLEIPIRVEAPGQPIGWSTRFDNSVAARDQARHNLKYTVISEQDSPQEDVLRRCKDTYAAAMNTFTYGQLAYQDLSPKSIELVKQITAGKTTPYDKTVAIRDYLQSSSFFYTINPPPLPTEHPVDTFLNSTRIGHCELFAGAMALMVRSQGIPARVVKGYRGGEWNPSDLSYTIRASMAHLWVEVYFLGYGWVTFDPSPLNEGSEAATVSWLSKTVSRYSMRSKMLWYQYVIGYNPRRLFVNLNSWSLRALAGGSGSSNSRDGAAGGASPMGGAALLVLETALGLGAVLLAWKIWTRLHASRSTLSEDQTRAIRLFRRLRAKAQRLGVDCRGKTAEEMGREFVRLGWIGADEANAVIRTYSDARFGGKPLPVDEYRKWLHTVRSLRLGAPG
ncbi:MAG: DUF3488 domain-containing protein [Candidatus Hydrogenedentes bacterium]|nr:DUF3488 domain-containing protein [Candidatus Hydrogenedentota bacterium]